MIVLTEGSGEKWRLLAPQAMTKGREGRLAHLSQERGKGLDKDKSIVFKWRLKDERKKVH